MSRVSAERLVEMLTICDQQADEYGWTVDPWGYLWTSEELPSGIQIRPVSAVRVQARWWEDGLLAWSGPPEKLGQFLARFFFAKKLT